MSSAERDPVRWRDRTDQTDTAERRIGHAVRCLQTQRLRPPPSRARVLVRVRCAAAPKPWFKLLPATAFVMVPATAFVLGMAVSAFAARLTLPSTWLPWVPRAKHWPAARVAAVSAHPAHPAPALPPGPVASFPAFVVAEVGTGSAAPVMTAGNADGQRRGHKMAASASGSARIMTAWARHDRNDPQLPPAGDKSRTPPAASLASLASPAPTPAPIAAAPAAPIMPPGPATAGPGEGVLPPTTASPSVVASSAQSSVERELAGAAPAPPSSRTWPRPPPAPSLRPSSPPSQSGLVAEDRFAAAVASLRVRHAPEETLRLLDRYGDDLDRDGLAPEALTLRVEALLTLGRLADVLHLLDRSSSVALASTRALLVTRGLLRSEAHRCREAIGDFDLALTLAKRASREALIGRALCRGQLGDNEGLQADIARLQREFPHQSLPSPLAR